MILFHGGVLVSSLERLCYIFPFSFCFVEEIKVLAAQGINHEQWKHLAVAGLGGRTHLDRFFDGDPWATVKVTVKAIL